MNILLVGGTGFIGEYLVRRLNNKSNCLLTVIHSKFLPRKNQLKRVTYFKINLLYSKNHLKIKNIINTINTLVILTPPNLKIIKKLAEIIKSTDKDIKIIYLSSILIYPNSPYPQTEQTIPCPQTRYEKLKVKEEHILSKLTDKKAMKLCIARLSNVYGDKKNKGIIHKIYDSILNNYPLIINNKGIQVRDFIFIEDLVNLINLLILHNQKRKIEIYNLSSAKGYKILDLIDIISNITKIKIRTEFKKGLPEKREIIGENNKILQLAYNHKLEYDLNLGLKKTYQNYLI